MKIGLSTDYGSPHHWQRLVTFASAHDVDRLVFWADSSTVRFGPPWLFPKHPELLNDEWRAQRRIIRERMAHAAELTRGAGMEFWYCFQVLMLPPIDHVRRVRPELFNPHGEPDMANPAIYELLREQIDEAMEIAPELHGLELWIMECASIVLSRLKHQSLSIEQIVRRIVETVHDHCDRHGLRLAVDLHTAGGDLPTLEALLVAASEHDDVLISGENVIGDFHLHLPFNAHLRRAARTNPVQVHFDLNGEYWGRNFFPTVALDHYTRHLDQARALGNVEYVDGRIATCHDSWSPHDNVLPSRRRCYPALADLQPGQPVPRDVEVCCFDTLNGFNAEYFVRRAKDSSVQPREVVRAFLAREFGSTPDVDALAWLMEQVEPVNARIFFADKNYFLGHSVMCQLPLAAASMLDVHVTTPAGGPFPPAEADAAPRVLHSRGSSAFAGWPVPTGHRAAGPGAMIAEKQLAAAETEALLEMVDQMTASFSQEDRQFVLRQFQDLAQLARTAAAVLEAIVHHCHLELGRTAGRIPDRDRLQQALGDMQAIRTDWLKRSPERQWMVDCWMKDWHELITGQALSPTA